MGAHIVKRRPPVSPPQPAELRRTTELTDRQLHELIFDQARDRAEHVHDELEAELELVDSLPKALPEGTPVSLPSTSSLRFARTLRRDIAAPPPMPSVSRPVHATPRSALPSIAAMQALPPSEVTPIEPLAASDTATRSRLFGAGFGAGQTILTFLVVFLMTFGVLLFLLP